MGNAKIIELHCKKKILVSVTTELKIEMKDRIEDIRTVERNNLFKIELS